jgi:hypothetical protein
MTSRSAMESSRSSRISACPRSRRLSRGRGARASTPRDPTCLARRARRASGRTCARGAPPCGKCPARWGDRHVTAARPGVIAAGRPCGMGLTCLSLRREIGSPKSADFGGMGRGRRRAPEVLSFASRALDAAANARAAPPDRARLRVAYPPDGARYLRDPSVVSRQAIRLRANVPPGVRRVAAPRTTFLT